MDDLRTGRLPLENSDMTAREAWNLVCRHLTEFAGVEHNQHCRNLKSHRTLVKKQLENSGWMLTALAHDRQLHPRRTKNARGEPIFDFTKAKAFLQQDVKDGKHKKMTPKKLWKSQQVYMLFCLDIFRQRIYQEIRAQKFNFYLGIKRAELLRKRRERHDRELHLMNVS